MENPYLQSFVGEWIIEFVTADGRVWKVVGYLHDGRSWRLRLEATARDGYGNDLDGSITLPFQNCLLFTRDSTEQQAERVNVQGIQVGSRVFVKARGGLRHELLRGGHHRRGTVNVVRRIESTIEIVYDKYEPDVGGGTWEIPIEDVLFDISAAVQGRNITSYGPLFEKGEWIETNQPWEVNGQLVGYYRMTVPIESIRDESKEVFKLNNALNERKINGQVRLDWVETH